MDECSQFLGKLHRNLMLVLPPASAASARAERGQIRKTISRAARPCSCWRRVEI